MRVIRRRRHVKNQAAYEAVSTGVYGRIDKSGFLVVSVLVSVMD